MTLTPEMAANVQRMMANVETTFRATNAARTALSALIVSGAATCSDIKAYNLQVKAAYAYQASVAGIIRANGGSAPSVAAPIYVAYKDPSGRVTPGEEAANVDCEGGRLRGWQPNQLGDYFVNPQQVEWRQEVLPSDAKLVSEVVKAGVAASQGLGVAPVVAAAIPLIIQGIIVIVAAVIILKIAEVLMDIPGKVETTKQVAIQAEQHKLTLERRASCYTSCTAGGKDTTLCARDCSRLNPDFFAQFPGGKIGFFGTLAAVGVVGLLGFAVYRYYQGGGFDTVQEPSSRRALLPAGIDERDVIDAEYTERVA